MLTTERATDDLEEEDACKCDEGGKKNSENEAAGKNTCDDAADGTDALVPLPPA